MLCVYMYLFALVPFYDNIYPLIGGIRIREIHRCYRGGNCHSDIIRIDGRVFLYLFGDTTESPQAVNNAIHILYNKISFLMARLFSE